MNKLDFPDDSDSSDEDYTPTTNTEVVSEVESDGDPEDPLSDSEIGDGKKKRKRKAGSKQKKNAAEVNKKEETEESPKKETEVDKKKRADLIWESFKKDSNFKSIPKVQSKELAADGMTKSVQTPPKKIKVTEVIEFAGEEMQIEKEIAADSAEAKKITASSSEQKKAKAGISSILSQLGKKTKITTLEKSKLDWDKFKKDENIEDDLQRYNKGKNGYLDRQDFLQRADLRRFEIEKEVRTIERNKRMNNV